MPCRRGLHALFVIGAARLCLSRGMKPSGGGGLVGIPAGLLDDDPGVKPSKHIFTGSKAPWWEIMDNVPQYEEWFPGFNLKKMQ